MALQVDKTAARHKIIDAYNHRNKKNDGLAKDIETILRGSHKTYRYVLVTALISKATNGDIDPLSLQAQDDSIGAYDARSIAHGVLVPFEREYLPNSLGGSNEPYLNKPARFPRLTAENAVRRGTDQMTLELLIEVLGKIRTASKAFEYLKSAIAVMEEISHSINKKYEIPTELASATKNIQMILDYIWELSSKSCEGETCAIIVAALEQLYNPKDYKVIAHKVNESGSSSKEVGDVDILDKQNKIVSSIEVKDKDFVKEDVQHAITKFIDAKLSRTLFIYGKSANFNHTEVYQLAARYGRLGCFCSVISILDYAKLRLNSIDAIELNKFLEILLMHAKTINAKDETIEWLKETALKLIQAE